MFRRIFGESKSKENRLRRFDDENQDAIRTINQLQQTEELLEKKIDKIDQQINSIEDKARQCLNKSNPDKKEALLCLKQRKKLEQEREKLYKMKENLQSVNGQVQSSQLNRQITQSLHIGNKHLKQIQKTMPLDKAEILMDEINETIENANETSEILARPISNQNDLIVSDADLENELNQLNNDIIRENLTKINSLPSTPQPSIVEQQIKQLQRLIAE